MGIMISLPMGVKVAKAYDAEMSKVGRGVLYLLSNGILFEKKGEGAKFECNFDYMASFEAKKKDRLLVSVRTSQGPKSVEFKVDSAKIVESDISQANQEYARNDSINSGPTNEVAKQSSKFDHDEHSRSEARWFKDNWNDIMKFLKPERVSYLNEYVKTAKTGSPNVDPYLLIVKYENLTYKDFADLPGFLKWRYDSITNKEVDLIVGVFREFDGFSARTLEMEIQICKPLEPKFKKDGYSLYQFVAIVAREKLESGRERISQPQALGNNKHDTTLG